MNDWYEVNESEYFEMIEALKTLNEESGVM